MSCRSTIFFLCCLLSVALIGCASTSKSESSIPPETNPLIGKWQFEYFLNEKGKLYPPGSNRYTVEFDEDTVFLSIEENKGFAPYIVKKNRRIDITSKIVIADIDWGFYSVGERFLESFYKARRYNFNEEGMLVLTSSDDHLYFSSAR